MAAVKVIGNTCCDNEATGNEVVAAEADDSEAAAADDDDDDNLLPLWLLLLIVMVSSGVAMGVLRAVFVVEVVVEVVAAISGVKETGEGEEWLVVVVVSSLGDGWANNEVPLVLRHFFLFFRALVGTPTSWFSVCVSSSLGCFTLVALVVGGCCFGWCLMKPLTS